MKVIIPTWLDNYSYTSYPEKYNGVFPRNRKVAVLHSKSKHNIRALTLPSSSFPKLPFFEVVCGIVLSLASVVFSYLSGTFSVLLVHSRFLRLHSLFRSLL